VAKRGRQDVGAGNGGAGSSGEVTVLAVDNEEDVTEGLTVKTGTAVTRSYQQKLTHLSGTISPTSGSFAFSHQSTQAYALEHTGPHAKPLSQVTELSDPVGKVLGYGASGLAMVGSAYGLYIMWKRSKQIKRAVAAFGIGAGLYAVGGLQSVVDMAKQLGVGGGHTVGMITWIVGSGANGILYLLQMLNGTRNTPPPAAAPTTANAAAAPVTTARDDVTIQMESDSEDDNQSKNKHAKLIKIVQKNRHS